MNTDTLLRPSSSTWFQTAQRPAQRRHLVARLFEKHHLAVQAYARHLGAQEADAEDVCSIVFEVAFRRLDSFRGASSPRTWLFGIARRVLSDRRRSGAARYEDLLDVLPERPTGATPEDTALETEVQEQVVTTVRALPSSQRQVVQEFMLEERPMAEVAARAQVPLQTAYARLYAAQRRLGTELRAVG